MSGFQKLRVFFIAMLGLFGAACDDDPATVNQPRAELPAYNYVSSTGFIIEGNADGHIYTLDLATQELRRDDGYILELDQAGTSEAANGMMSVVELDVINESVDVIPYPGCQVEPCVIDPLSSGPEPHSSQGRENGRKFQPVRIRQVTKAPRGFTKLSFDLMSFDEGPCVDVYRLLREYSDGWRSRRPQLLPMLFDAVMGTALAPDVPPGPPARIAATGTAVLNTFVQWGADVLASKISASVLAGYWNSYNCSSVRINSYPPSWPASGAVFSHCEVETFALQIGNNTYMITANVCYYN